MAAWAGGSPLRPRYPPRVGGGPAGWQLPDLTADRPDLAQADPQLWQPEQLAGQLRPWRLAAAGWRPLGDSSLAGVGWRRLLRGQWRLAEVT